MVDKLTRSLAPLRVRLGILLIAAAFNQFLWSQAAPAGQFGSTARIPGLPFQEQASGTTGRVLGTLRDVDWPIKDADIYLQRFDDEKCAKLFVKKDYNPYDPKAVDNLKRRIEKCSHDLPRMNPDQQGRYEFHAIKPGWYALRFLWDIHQKPKENYAVWETNGFTVLYYGAKDLQKKYDAMAQGTPFYFSGDKDIQIDYDGGRRLKSDGVLLQR